MLFSCRKKFVKKSHHTKYKYKCLETICKLFFMKKMRSKNPTLTVFRQHNVLHLFKNTTYAMTLKK